MDAFNASRSNATLEKVQEKHNLMDVSDCDAITFRSHSKDNRRIYNVAFERDALKASIIAHEALHITNFILEDICYIPKTENDEIQCYLLGWVVESICKLLTKSKIKVKNG